MGTCELLTIPTTGTVDTLTIFEGPTDLLSIYQLYNGITPFTACACWASTVINTQHLKNLAQPNRKIITFGDGDKAGRKMNHTVAGILDNKPVYAARIPNGLDIRKILETATNPKETFEAIYSLALLSTPLIPTKRLEAHLDRSEYKVDADLTMLVEKSGGKIIRRGTGGNLLCLCPFHEDKEPSLSIHPDKGMFICFGGCGEGGIGLFKKLMRDKGIIV